MTETAVVGSGADVQSGHLRRSTLAVLVNTAVTGVLGAAFWLLAARLYPEQTVASSVAASSLLIAVAFIAQLNLNTSLSRFLPGAGRQMAGMVTFSYAVAVGAASVAAAGLVALGLARGGSLVAGGDVWLTVVTAASVPVWVIFALQDGALVAVRRANWLPVENGVTAAIKLLLLPLLVGVGGHSAIMLAWTVPIVPAIMLVNYFLFSRMLHAGDDPVEERWRIVRYGGTDLLGVAATVLSLRVVPLLVTEIVGGNTAAYVGVPWSILTVSALALTAISRMLLAEMAHQPDAAAQVAARTRKFVLGLFIPGAVLGALLSHPVLSFAGRGYASDGTWVLALGAFGLVAAAVLECRLAEIRFAGQMLRVTLIQTGRAVALTGLVLVVVLGDRPELVGAMFALANIATLIVVRLRPNATQLRAGAATVVGAIGVGVASIAMSRVDLAAIDALGLFSALPALYFIGVGLVVVGLIVSLGDHRLLHVVAWLHVIALTFLLHGLPGFVEPVARFPVAWLHTGFADHIAQNGTLLQLLDARFSWAGFFAGSGYLQQMSGGDRLVWIIRFAPVAINLVAGITIYRLARLLRSTPPQATLAVAIFVIGNWIGQDYYSPQATNFLLYLIVVLVVLWAFPADPTAVVDRRTRLLRPRQVDDPAVVGRPATLITIGLVVVVCAMVVGHQLSPGFLISVLLLLVLVRRIRTTWLPVIVLVLFMGWLSYGAQAYWAGHFEKLVGSVGDVSGAVGANVGRRVSGGDPNRKIVLYARLGMMGALWLTSAVLVVRQWRRRSVDTAVLCLLVAPFPMLIVQPYGGEMLLRISLFTLPAVGILLARSMLGVASPSSRGHLVRWGAGSLVMLVAVPIFVIARFGNESFEQVSRNDHAVVSDLYEAAPDGTVVYVRSRQSLVFSQRVGEVRFRELSRGTVEEVVDELRNEATNHAVFIMFSESQDAYGVSSRGETSGWLTVLGAEYLSYDGIDVASRHGDSVLISVQPRAKDAT